MGYSLRLAAVGTKCHGGMVTAKIHPTVSTQLAALRIAPASPGASSADKTTLPLPAETETHILN